MELDKIKNCPREPYHSRPLLSDGQTDYKQWALQLREELLFTRHCWDNEKALARSYLSRATTYEQELRYRDKSIQAHMLQQKRLQHEASAAQARLSVLEAANTGCLCARETDGKQKVKIEKLLPIGKRRDRELEASLHTILEASPIWTLSQRLAVLDQIQAKVKQNSTSHNQEQPSKAWELLMSLKPDIEQSRSETSTIKSELKERSNEVCVLQAELSLQKSLTSYYEKGIKNKDWTNDRLWEDFTREFIENFRLTINLMKVRDELERVQQHCKCLEDQSNFRKAAIAPMTTAKTEQNRNKAVTIRPEIADTETKETSIVKHDTEQQGKVAVQEGQVTVSVSKTENKESKSKGKFVQ